jgi:hypothetical protein
VGSGHGSSPGRAHRSRSTKKRPVLSAGPARALHLAAQALLSRPLLRPTREDVRAAVARMALLQIDTIHVVARSPHLVLFSRLGDYDPAWLDLSVTSEPSSQARRLSWWPSSVRDSPPTRRLCQIGRAHV